MDYFEKINISSFLKILETVYYSVGSYVICKAIYQ